MYLKGCHMNAVPFEQIGITYIVGAFLIATNVKGFSSSLLFNL